MNDSISDRIRPVTRRLRSLRLWRLLGLIALVVGLAGLGVYVDARGGGGISLGPQLAFAMLLGAVIAFLIAFVASRLSYRDPRLVASQIEDQFPSLKQRLLTALSQSENEEQLGYLQRRVINEARDHSWTHRWTDVVPTGKLILSRLSGLVATAFMCVVLSLLAVSEQTSRTGGSSSSNLSAAKINIAVTPGDTEVARGTSLVITARFEGIARELVPDQAELICVDQDGDQRRITMTQNLDDPVVGGFVASIDKPFTYQIITDDWESDTYSVDVFEFPTLVRSDAQLDYPEYTKLEDKRVEDTVRVSAVVGTEVKWICFLNKDVISAELVSKDGSERIALEPDDASPGAYSTSIDLQETKRLTLKLVDADHRENRYPPELIARVLPNQPPKLKLSQARDVVVSPIEELLLGAEVRDDFGVARAGMSYRFSGGPIVDMTLGEEIPRGATEKLERLVEFEALEAEPDQLFAYFFWAEDFGPDGDVRRTESDMFFAEVRPFDEIFREGQPPPSGQQQQQQQQNQNGQQAEQLAELQKEIINATWTVIRAERGEQPSQDFGDNATLLKDSQSDAILQMEQLAEKIQDERSLKIVEVIRGAMTTAYDEFSNAVDGNDVDPLDPAMIAAQQAYAGLLKLRAREFEVQRRQQQQNQGQPQNRSAQRRQQQINELEIDQEENRYETQQQAQENSEQEQLQREIRQVLNRLRELARRQEDLNKELAQLQSALEQAETEEEQEEIKRQLQRLREQQQDLLRETDELAERMQQPENQQQMSDAAERLDETRENVRRASEALRENDAAEALSAGKRAEREFEEMRDEFRREAAGAFNETMRQMRSDAQELDQNQEKLSEQLANIDENDPAQGLRGTDPREEILKQLDQQREQLGELLDKMQETVEQAESAEPLLAQKLYDSYRKTRQRQVDRSLENTSELLRRGYDPQAQEFEKQAAEGLDQLREDLEEAASTVLGDETEALARALSQLERLERSLDDEIRRNDPQQGTQENAESGQPASQSNQQRGGDRPSENQQDGQQQNRQPSSQQQGGQNPNESDNPSEQSSQQQSGQPNAQQRSDSDQPQQQGQQQSSQQGQQSSQQPGQQSQQQSQQQGQQQSQQQGQQESQQQGQPSQQQGQQREGQQQQQQGQPSGQAGQQPQSQNQQQGQQPNGQPQGSQQRQSAMNQFAAENPGLASPLTGDGFREWTDGLRDVEEMVDDPELRSRAARIRDRAREMRRDYKRHSKEPRWALVDEMIATPLRELRRDVSEELLRRSADKNANVPIDRDPVPDEYADAVRKYYESLGSGR